MARIVSATAALALAVLVSGCPLKPPPSPAEIRQQAAGTVGELATDATWKAAPVPSGPVEDDWLATFGDARLAALVAEAMANNPDLRVAGIRVEQAAAYVRMARAALRPQIGVFGTGGLNASGGDASSALQGIVVSASWEPDLWGRLRYARNAAQETYASVDADREFARQSLAASVAKSWFESERIAAAQGLAESMASSGRTLVELAEQRVRVGVGNEQEASVVRAQREGLEDVVVSMKLARSQTLRALELLVGRYPAAELATPEDLPALPADRPAGLPLQMLERRPDLVAAERRVAAAFNRVGEAKAARLPRIVLGASISALKSDVLQLKDDFDNPSFGAGARLLAPIYQGGALKTQVEIRTLEQKESIAEYARIALRALGDVENAIAADATLEEREAVLERSVSERSRAVELADRAQRVGRADRRTLLQRQIELDDARRALLDVRAERLSQRVNLHLALGGSFEPAPEPATESTPPASSTPPAEPQSGGGATPADVPE